MSLQKSYKKITNYVDKRTKKVYNSVVHARERVISEGWIMKKSVFYEKAYRIACLSVIVSAVGCGIYVVLSDNGFIPKVETVLPDSRIGKAVSYIRELL